MIHYYMKVILFCLFIVLLESAGANDQHGHSKSSSLTARSSHLDFPNKMLYVENPWSVKDRIEPSGDISKKCLFLLEVFSNATSVYLKCIMCNARPLHYCENCVSEYTKACNAYTEISKYQENGTRCKDELERADNVQVVNLVSGFVVDVWEKSYCHKCYIATTENGTTVYSPTEETRQMLIKIEEVQQCFRDFSNNDVGNTTVCSICRTFYSQANDYYNKLDKENKLCSDLIDSMNYTRRMWSKDFDCTIAIRTDKMIYGMAVAVGCIPVIFYITLYVLAKRQITISLRGRRDSEIQALSEDVDLPDSRASASDSVDL